VLGGLVLAEAAEPGDSWTSTAVLAVAGTATVVLDHRFRSATSARFPHAVPGSVSAVLGLALAGSLQHAPDQGWWIATGLGLTLLTAWVFAEGRTRLAAGLLAAGATLTMVHAALLADAERLGELSLVALAATVPAIAAAVHLPWLRRPGVVAALLAPASAILLAREDGILPAPTAGLLLALLAATAFAVATVRREQEEERDCVVLGAVIGLAAGATTGAVGAWGQVGLQLAVVGVAAGCYALVAHDRWVAVGAVADLVLAAWIAIGGAGVETPEAYSLPAAAGLLVLAIPALRTGSISWAAEGPAVGAALVPSALVVVADPTALRLALLTASAVAVTAAGTLRHRQAPFVLGAGVLLFVAVGRLSPYAPLLPRWLTLGTAGLLLLVLGATYEQRRQQAREAVAWVGQMS
jgi:hypothetical protein